MSGIRKPNYHCTVYWIRIPNDLLFCTGHATRMVSVLCIGPAGRRGAMCCFVILQFPVLFDVLVICACVCVHACACVHPCVCVYVRVLHPHFCILFVVSVACVCLLRSQIICLQKEEKREGHFIPATDSIDIAKDMVTRLEQEQRLAQEKLQKAQAQV